MKKTTETEKKIAVVVMILTTFSLFGMFIAHNHLNPLTWLIALFPVVCGITAVYWKGDDNDDK